jgi:hypothetical protein
MLAGLFVVKRLPTPYFELNQWRLNDTLKSKEMLILTTHYGIRILKNEGDFAIMKPEGKPKTTFV